MSDRTPVGTRLATLPVSPRRATPSRTGVPRRRNGLARRWDRLGWPIVELLGAAALIVGLVSVLMGGSGDGLPALVPGFGQTTQVSTPAVAAGEVAMAQGNAGRTGEMPGPGVRSDPTLRWRLPVDAMDESGRPGLLPDAGSTVLVSGGMVLSVERQSTQGSPTAPPLADVTLHAIDAATSDEHWSTTFNGVSLGSPVIADGLVFVAVDPLDGVLSPSGGTPDPNEQVDRTRGYVVAFDASTGAERWRTAVGLVGYQSPVFADGMVFVMDRDGYARGLDSQTGEIQWSSLNVPSAFAISYEPREPQSSSVSVAGGLVVVTSYSGFTYAFRLDTGDVAWYWPQETGNGVDDYGSGFQRNTIDPVISGDTVFLSTNRNNGTNVFAAVSLQTGQERWTRETQGYEPSPVAVADGVAVLTVGPYNGRSLRAIDVATGQDVLWDVPASSLDEPIPTIADGIVYAGNSDSSVRAIDLRTGDVLWTVRTGGAIASQIYAGNGTVYFMSQDDWLYAVGGSGDPGERTVSGSEVDISGLPPCDVTPRPMVYATPIPDGGPAVLPTVPLPSATPAFTLPDIVVGEQQTQAPAMRWDDLPSGTTVSEEQASGIAATLERMQSCSRPGNGAYLAAFSSDDYFLRPWVVWRLAYDGYSSWGGASGALDQNQILATGRVLPDGRVAVVQTSEWSPDYGNLIVFVEVDGQWLIDEWVELTPDGKPSQG